MQQVKWAEFELQDLFEVNSSKKIFHANNLEIFNTKVENSSPYIARTTQNNGLIGYIIEDRCYLNPANTLSFAQDTFSVFYQEKPFYTGNKIKVLVSKLSKWNKTIGLFFSIVFQKILANCTWGLGSTVETISKIKILIPVKFNTDDNEINQIDFDFMERFIGELEAVRLAQLDTYLSITGLKDCTLTTDEWQALTDCQTGNITWGEYKMADLFDKVKTKKLPYPAKKLPTEPKDNYVLPCLTSSFKNQGLNYFAPLDGATVLKNVISIPSNSDVYRAYYQPNDFTVLSDAYAIKWKYDNKTYDAKLFLFIVASINQVTDLAIYSYKNKLGGWNVVKDKYIQLPTKNNLPDMDKMQTIISALQKAMIKEVVAYTGDKLET